jgi:hypothetical protein
MELFYTSINVNNVQQIIILEIPPLINVTSVIFLVLLALEFLIPSAPLAPIFFISLIILVSAYAPLATSNKNLIIRAFFVELIVLIVTIKFSVLNAKPLIF